MTHITNFLIAAALVLTLNSCCKDEPVDCSQTVECYTAFASYTTCEVDKQGNPIYLNITIDTSYSVVSVCETDEYISQAKRAEADLIPLLSDDDKKFFAEHPVQCGCPE